MWASSASQGEALGGTGAPAAECSEGDELVRRGEAGPAVGRCDAGRLRVPRLVRAAGGEGEGEGEGKGEGEGDSEGESALAWLDRAALDALDPAVEVALADAAEASLAEAGPVILADPEPNPVVAGERGAVGEAWKLAESERERPPVGPAGEEPVVARERGSARLGGRLLRRGGTPLLPPTPTTLLPLNWGERTGECVGGACCCPCCPCCCCIANAFFFAAALEGEDKGDASAEGACT